MMNANEMESNGCERAIRFVNQTTLPTLILLIIHLAFCGGNQAAENQRPKHLVNAIEIIKHLDLGNTSYLHGKPDVQFAQPCRSHADCSGFLSELLATSYGFTPEQFKMWFGRERPTADRYHDAIIEQEIFERIPSLKDVHPGDILAVKYQHPKEKSTGHLMLVAGTPRLLNHKEPIFPATEQWEIPIIDSARSGHGKNDTRHAKGQNGKDHDGLGEGILRVYTEQNGEVFGHTWSVSGKHFLSQQEENMAIGRLRPIK